MQRLTRGNLLATLQELKRYKKPATAMPDSASVQAIVSNKPYKQTAKVTACTRNTRFARLIKLNSSMGGLLERLTVLQGYSIPYSGEPRGELFIHWYYRDRYSDTLSKCEIFHLNMLLYFNVVNRVETIHIRCATKGGLTNAMACAKGILSRGKATVDFKVVPQKTSWEHDTFMECVEYATQTGKFVYYTHFKGVSHIHDSNLIGSYRNNSGTRITPLNVLYWCYVMYRYLFVDAPKDSRVIGPLYYPKRPTLHYVNRRIIPRWSLPISGHYTGSFQAFDGSFLSSRFNDLGATKDERARSLWVSDPYTVEQFLTICFYPNEISSLCDMAGSYEMYSGNKIPAYRKDFDNLYNNTNKNICVANGTYKWIGGTDTFNWAMCKALIDKGYTVYYYAPDMDGKGVTEKYLREIGALPYIDGTPLIACFANQQSGSHFVDICPVVQTCHSAFTMLEYPIKGAQAYISISEEIQLYLKARGFQTDVIRNGIDLNRYFPRKPLNAIPQVLSICQGDDTLLKAACAQLGWRFKSVPKDVGSRIWHIEDLINDSDIVVGIGRSLYDAMACGRVCISWDNRKLNPYAGCGYVTADNWYYCAKTNFTGRGFPQIHTVDGLIAELKKYDPKDGAIMRSFAEKELDMHKNILKYLNLVSIPV